MNKLKKTGIIIGSILGSVYVVFLAAPLVLNPIINSYSPQIKNIIHDSTGLESELSNVKVVTTPKLTAGLKVGRFALLEPNNAEIFSADDFQVKMSLLPLLARKIEVDAVQLKNAKANILINPDGKLAVEKYLPENEPETEATPITELPLGFKLSNHLPDIKIGGYDIIITDGVDKYTLIGDKTEITDFILDKSIKVKASGRAVLKDREQFNYNLKVLNKIMPEIELNDLVFNPAPQEEKPVTEPVEFDIIGILQGIYANNLTGSVDADLNIAKDLVTGKVDLSNLSIINLPPSSAVLKFKDHSLNINSDIYTAKNEVTKINGLLKGGSSPNIDLNLKSKVEIANILRIVKEAAMIFGVKDLQTLSANGKLDADFNIKSNMKTVKSSGYLNVPSADVYYGLYKIGVDNINADVKLDNNNINIQNIGFSILNQPLKLYGTISSNAVSDLHLTANNLSLKGLLVAAGQAALMKENQVNSGTVTMNADIQGKLNKIKPVLKLDIEDINIKNLPSNTALIAPQTAVNIVAEGTSFGGSAKSTGIRVNNPAAKVTIPEINANIGENEITISPANVTIEKINLNVSGKIKNYLTEKIGLDFVTSGDIKSALTGDMNVLKQTLNLNYATTEA